MFRGIPAFREARRKSNLLQGCLSGKRRQRGRASAHTIRLAANAPFQPSTHPAHLAAGASAAHNLHHNSELHGGVLQTIKQNAAEGRSAAGRRGGRRQAGGAARHGGGAAWRRRAAPGRCCSCAAWLAVLQARWPQATSSAAACEAGGGLAAGWDAGRPVQAPWLPARSWTALQPRPGAQPGSRTMFAAACAAVTLLKVLAGRRGRGRRRGPPKAPGSAGALAARHAQQRSKG